MDKGYYLIPPIDNSHIQLERMCEVASYIALNYKGTDVRSAISNESLIKKYWKYDKYPPNHKLFAEKISNANIKWFLRNKINSDINERNKDVIGFQYCSEKEWNADFVNGLATHGKLEFYKNSFPTLKLTATFIKEAIESSPFGGYFIEEYMAIDPRRDKEKYLRGKKRTFKQIEKSKKEYDKEILLSNTTFGNYTWKNASVFYIQYFNNTPSYLAGIFATGCLSEKEKDGEKFIFVKYNIEQVSLLQFLGIPIEIQEKNYCYISPIWPMLFVKFMPEFFRKRWIENNIKKGYMVDEYAPTLWYIFINCIFVKNGLPFLKCKRQIYYDLKKLAITKPIVIDENEEKIAKKAFQAIRKVKMSGRVKRKENDEAIIEEQKECEDYGMRSDLSKSVLDFENKPIVRLQKIWGKKFLYNLDKVIKKVIFETARHSRNEYMLKISQYAREREEKRIRKAELKRLEQERKEAEKQAIKNIE